LLQPSRAALARRRLAHIAWHDTEDGALAAEGLALVEERQGRVRQWRLERVAPAEGEAPSVVGAALASAGRPEALGRELPGPLRTVARFEGTRRSAELAGGDGQVALLEGALHTSRGEMRVARLVLSGAPGGAFALADGLLADLPLAVPGASLAEEALGVARADAPAASPLLPAGLEVGEALAWLVAVLTRVLLVLAPGAAAGKASEPVHQMRVALRRLRTAIALLKPLLPAAAALAEASEGLRGLARALGPAREWDVFLEGTAPAIKAAFPEDAAIARLLEGARRRREGAYAALREELAGAGFRRLMLRLAAIAVLRPWRREGERGPETPLATVAPALLQRRHRKLLSAAAEIETADAAHLHAVRLRAKRLRYAGELLCSLFPRKEVARFLRRLVRLQDRLGILNDAACVERLLGELGRTGSGRAGGIVLGFVAASAVRERSRIGPTWRKFRKHPGFWG
jgi:CHAD domain-containing protein